MKFFSRRFRAVERNQDVTCQTPHKLLQRLEAGGLSRSSSSERGAATSRVAHALLSLLTSKNSNLLTRLIAVRQFQVLHGERGNVTY